MSRVLYPALQIRVKARCVVKTARLLKCRAHFFARTWCVLKNGFRHVVQDVCCHVEIDGVAAGFGCVRARSGSAGVPYHSPAVSPGRGIIALTKTSFRTGTAPTSGAVKPPSETAPHANCQATLSSNVSQKSVVHAGYRPRATDEKAR